MNHTTEPQATGGSRHVPIERLQHYNPEVEQRVQGWFASGQPLVWIPILSQENFPDVPQQLLEFADHYQEAMRCGCFAFWPAYQVLPQPVARLRVASLGSLQCTSYHAAPVVQCHAVQQHAHVIAFGAPVVCRAFDVFRLLTPAHDGPFQLVECLPD